MRASSCAVQWEHTDQAERYLGGKTGLCASLDREGKEENTHTFSESRRKMLSVGCNREQDRHGSCLPEAYSPVETHTR